jgi:hypothetical protein
MTAAAHYFAKTFCCHAGRTALCQMDEGACQTANFRKTDIVVEPQVVFVELGY